MKTLIKNVKIVNSDKITQGNILIENDCIVDITNENATADKVVDGNGNYAFAGFIDLHVHMREPGFEYKEDLRSAGEVAVAGGITTACCMANTKPCIDNSSVASYIVNKAKNDGLIDVLPYGSVTKGMKGVELTEMGDLLDAGVGGFSDDGHTIMNAEVMRRGLEYCRHFDSFIASHAIDTDLQGDGDIHEGVTSAITGLRGIPSTAEATIVARDILLARLTKSRVHICHISSKEAVDLVRWGKSEGINVTAEVTPHHFTLTDKCCETFDTNYKMSPPLRSDEDVEAIKQALKDGTIDCIATDHAPHQADEKFVEFGLAPVGIIGMQTAISFALSLVDKGIFTLEDIARTFSYNPAKILRKDNIGSIVKGKKADITIINPNLEYVFDASVNRSKSMNTPFYDCKLKGRATHTFKNGKLVYEL